MPKEKKYSDTTLINALSARGCQCQCAWQVHKIKGTGIEWLEGWMVAHPGGFPTFVIIQTFERGGWEAYTPGDSHEVDATVEDVFQRTRRMPPPSALV